MLLRKGLKFCESSAVIGIYGFYSHNLMRIDRHKALEREEFQQCANLMLNYSRNPRSRNKESAQIVSVFLGHDYGKMTTNFPIQFVKYLPASKFA